MGWLDQLKRPTRLMKLRRQISPLYLSFPLILIAALALGRYSFRNARQLAQSTESSVIAGLFALGDQTRSRVESFIIDSDRELFNLVDLEHLQDFSRRWSEIVRLSHAVEAAIVLDENQELVKGGYVNKRRNKPEADAFLRLFREKIRPDLPLAEQRPDFHRHLHITVEGVDYLLSYIKRYDAARNRVFYIILKVNLDYLVGTCFPEMFEPIAGRFQVSVLDSRNEVIFGQRIKNPGKYLYDRRFESTVYQWRLQMAPTGNDRLLAGIQKQVLTDTVLIGLMLGLILVGTAFLVYTISTEQRLSALKSEFISNVSHELKTPLSLIRMFAELLMLGKIKNPEKGREYASIITRESERLSRLIDNVLDFSRMERGKAAYEMKPGDLGEVVERALDFFRYRLEREGRQLDVDIGTAIPRVNLDENAMTLLLLNLVDNAIKYGGQSPIRVRLTVSPRGNEIQLSVTDQGLGISEEEHRKIFERFYRTRAVRNTNIRGSGIGLALVKHIAEAHGGHMSVESQPGHGSTFTLTLPVISGEEERAHGDKHTADGEEKN
ncbi:MAG TPA: HAMP domain-containing sensor histidine kinase [Pseudomonadota bacterium]|jgi:two-component system phosphate regulon sensor histidine kinase PhoR|nr:HAMP domain-containing sensor histidine kinase [Pseudomonadota bacterium]